MKLTLLPVVPALIGLVAADTLTIDLHANNCGDTAFQTFTIGNIGECHTASQHFDAFVQRNIAQSFFGRNLGIRAFADADCQGSSSTDSLSNARSCVGNAGRSFMLTTRD